MKLKLFFLSIIVLLSLVAYQKYSEYSALKFIDSYVSCATAKGSKVDKSSPDICIDPFGAKFYRSLPSPSPKNLTYSISDNWVSYTIRDIGVSFEYPDSMKIVNDSGNIRIMTTDDESLNQLIIIYSNKGQLYGPSGTSAGNLVQADSIAFLNQLIPKSKLVYEGKTMQVFYGGNYYKIVKRGSTSFIISGMLEEDVSEDLSYMTESVFDQILSSFKFTD